MPTEQLEDRATNILLTHCDIHTSDPAIAKCNSVLIKGSRIQDVFYCPPGKESIPNNSIQINCSNHLVIPGLNDAHIHLLASAAVMTQYPLNHVTHNNFSHLFEIIKNIVNATAYSEWIGLYGLDDRFFFNEEFNSDFLDTISTHHPLFISNQTGHAIALNTPGLKMLNLDVFNENVDSGLVDVDDHGVINGKFFDLNSMIYSKIALLTNKFTVESNLAKLFRDLHKRGVTSVQDAGHKNQFDKLDRFDQFTSYEIPLRIGMMIECTAKNIDLANHIIANRKNSLVHLVGFKIMLSQSAGKYSLTDSELQDLVILSNSQGLRVAVHAVEEHSIKMALEAFSASHKIYPDVINRIEHCSEFTKTVLEASRTTPFYAVSQPGFILNRGDYYLSANHSSKIHSLYRFKTLLHAAEALAFSSDSPVIPPDPWEGFLSAENRLTRLNRRLGSISEQLNFKQILDCYTKNAALVEGQQAKKGEIKPSMLADIAVIKRPTTLSSNPVALTILDGNIVWNSNELTLTSH
tara:strand:+ start:13885 stop:15447 length:1563 start_codon:yes stop_codon:yes gene_type:complete